MGAVEAVRGVADAARGAVEAAVGAVRAARGDAGPAAKAEADWLLGGVARHSFSAGHRPSDQESTLASVPSLSSASAGRRKGMAPNSSSLRTQSSQSGTKQMSA